MKTTVLKISGVMLLTVMLMSTSCVDREAEEKKMANEQAATALAEKQAEEKRIAQEQAIAYTNAINTLLQADQNLASTTTYIDRGNSMRTLDRSLCPNDFAAAFIAHVQAWEKAGQIRALQDKLNSDDTFWSTIAESSVRDLLGLDGTPISDLVEAKQILKQSAAIASAAIASTWDTVEQLAVGYGATMPKKE